MTFEDYEDFVHECPDFDDCALGLAGETGEVLELIKKDRRPDDRRQPIDTDKLTKELGDVIFYAVRLGYKHGISFEDIIHTNVKKLTKRHDL